MSEAKARIIIVRKIGKASYAEAIDSVYRALRGSSDQGIDVADVDQEVFRRHAEEGWNVEILAKKTYSVVEKLASIEGYRVSDLFEALQGVTSGSNDLFVFNRERLGELDEKYGLSGSGLLFDCIAGEDIKPYSITIRKKILFPYRADANRGEWIPAFMTAKGDALDFTKALAPDEKPRDSILDRLNKRIAHRVIPPELAGAARYLADNYDRLRSREYEGKMIEEYAGVWYGYHRPRSLKIVKVPNIVTPRVVKEPRFALNTVYAIPLDNVIVLVPKDAELEKIRQELEEVLQISVSMEDLLRYTVVILNSKISHIILRTKATKIRGGYYTIDERYLSSIIIPRPKASDKNLVKRIYESIKSKSCESREAEDLIVSLYLRLTGLSRKDIESSPD